MNGAIRSTAALAMTLAVLAGCRGFAPASPDADLRIVIQRAQEKVFPALVFVKPVQQQFGSGERVRQRIFGSGVIISPDGLVVTNSHVARSASGIKCVLYNHEQVTAKVVGCDDAVDIALLQLQMPPGRAPLPTARFGDSDAVREGQFVMALGSPLGFSRSISFGIVSATRRYLDVGYYHLWIQTDAAINPGNSGGPLVNDAGEVIGINTMKAARGDNIGFAIPANTVVEITDQLRQRGGVARSYAGLQFQPIRDFLSDTVLDYSSGVLVGSVDDPSPASAAGLRAGDLVLQLNGTPLQGMYLEDLPAIRSRFAYLPVGAPATLQCQRGGEQFIVQILPEEKPMQQAEELDLPMWHCTVQEISPFRTPGLAYFVPRGVFIFGVRNPGNARESGLRSGDIILSLDGAPVPSLAAMKEAYRALSRLDRGQRTVLMEILRAGYRHVLVLDFNRDFKN